MAAAPQPQATAARLRSLQTVGILSGFAAGAWLGGAEAPTKLVTIGLSPLVVSLMMVAGVFLARWTLPALIHGTSYVRADVKQAPHLLVWAVLAGCIWSVANTLTIFAIREVGLSIAFPLWNSNSLLGIFWGFLLFNELRNASLRSWLGVVGGALLMFAGAVILALASAGAAASGAHAMRGVAAALGAGVLWGTMYIPYRKAYLSGMNPLSFVTFFTVGELGMMVSLALVYTGGVTPLWSELSAAHGVLFWLLLGGFVWVVGDIFQQYAAKYVGISRGIPLSNTNQLWGLAWGILVFGELREGAVMTQVIGGSLLMAAGACAIAFSTANANEHARWQEAAERESRRYGIDVEHVRARMLGEQGASAAPVRTWVDWALAGVATLIIAGFGMIAQAPAIAANAGWMLLLILAMLALLFASGVMLWRVTRFS